MWIVWFLVLFEICCAIVSVMLPTSASAEEVQAVPAEDKMQQQV